MATLSPDALAGAVAALSTNLALVQPELQICTAKAIFSSPFSILGALLLAINAAVPGSVTQTELLHPLGGVGGGNALEREAQLNSAMSAFLQRLAAPADGSGDAELLVASSIWAKPGIEIRPEYVQAMEKELQAVARTAASPAAINAWAAEVTRGLITEAVPEGLTFDAVLVNALYFKGLWEHPFDREATKHLPFTTAKGETKQVPMMTHTFKRGPGKPVQVLVLPGLYDAVRLPYKGGRLSAIAVLPEDPATSPATLAATNLADLANAPGWHSPFSALRVLLPRFKANSQAMLTPVLKAAGVKAAFSGASAEFGRLSDTPMHISEVVHTVVVEVDEAGTEAGAAAAVVMTRGMAMGPPDELKFDRPFLFVIVDNETGVALFSGVVADPFASVVATEEAPAAVAQ